MADDEDTPSIQEIYDAAVRKKFYEMDIDGKGFVDAAFMKGFLSDIYTNQGLENFDEELIVEVEVIKTISFTVGPN